MYMYCSFVLWHIIIIFVCTYTQKGFYSRSVNDIIVHL